MYKSKRTQSGGSTASLGLSFLSKVSKILLSYYKGSLHQMLSKPELLLSKGYQYNILRQRTKQYTIYKEWTYFNPNEYIKRYYVLTDTKQKTIVLTEYYKFHRDIPRHFILPITSSLSKYHDKRRRIEYIRISRMLIGHLEQPTTTQYSILTVLIEYSNFLVIKKSIGIFKFTKHEQSNTLVEIKKNLKEAINTSKINQMEFDLPQYNFLLQFKNFEYQNKSKLNHKSDTYSR